GVPFRNQLEIGPDGRRIRGPARAHLDRTLVTSCYKRKRRNASVRAMLSPSRRHEAVVVDEASMSTRMRRFVFLATCLTVIITVHAQDRAGAPTGRGAAPAGRGAARGATPARGVITFSDDQFLHYPLAAADQKYAAIDGRHVKTYVAALTAISRKYRD